MPASSPGQQRARRTTKRRPRISGIVPVYNGRAFLRAAVDSALNQDYPLHELIVVDDGSTDDSLSVLEDLRSPVPVHILRQANAGQSAARNNGAHHAQGDYLAFLDQDDLWYADHLTHLIRPMLKDSRIGWAYSDLDEVDVHGGIVTKRFLSTLGTQHPKRNLISLLSYDMFVLPSASLIRKDAFLAVSGFDEQLSGYEDDDLFLRLFRAGYRNVFLKRALSQWRIYPTSSSYTPRMSRSRRVYGDKLVASFPDNLRMHRHYVRDCIAPRFTRAFIVEYIEATLQTDWPRARSAYEQAAHFARFCRKSTLQKAKFAAIREPRLLHYALRIVRQLPTGVRQKLAGAVHGYVD